MSTESHLSLDATVGDYVVDMSSVVRDQGLCTNRVADLQRFSGLIDALVAHARDEGVLVYGVADWSLLRHHALGDEERATLKRWYRRGLIEVRDGADDRILELADATGMIVVSRDNYTDYCRPYPWVAGNRDRFLLPFPGPGGQTVSVRPRTMPVPTEAQMSRKEEEGLLLKVGMYDRGHGTGARRELLSRRWLCSDGECVLFGADRPAVQPLPRYRNGVVSCPTHRGTLRDAGPYPRRVQIKVRVGAVVRSRFVMEPGKQIAVGRAPDVPGVPLAAWLDHLDKQVAARISRSHVMLRWDGWKISVADTSRNGTRIRRQNGRERQEFGLEPGVARRLRPGDVVVLADGVELTSSARQFVFDEPTADPAARTRLGLEADQETALFPGQGPDGA